MGNSKKKNLMNKHKKKLNATLECHMVGLHVLSYEVSGKKKKVKNKLPNTLFLESKVLYKKKKK